MICLPPKSPAIGDSIDLHDAEIDVLMVSDFGRRLVMSVTARVDRGNYDQPIEVVLSDPKHLTWSDRADDYAVQPIRQAGTVGFELRYGSSIDSVNGLDLAVTTSRMLMVAGRADRVDASPMPNRADLPSSDLRFSPLESAIVFWEHGLIPARGESHRLRLEAVALYPMRAVVDVTMRVDHPSETQIVLRAKHLGVAEYHLLRLLGNSTDVRHVKLNRMDHGVELQVWAGVHSVAVLGENWAVAGLP